MEEPEENILTLLSFPKPLALKTLHVFLQRNVPTKVKSFIQCLITASRNLETLLIFFDFFPDLSTNTNLKSLHFMKESPLLLFYKTIGQVANSLEKLTIGIPESEQHELNNLIGKLPLFPRVKSITVPTDNSTDIDPSAFKLLFSLLTKKCPNVESFHVYRYCGGTLDTMME